MDKQTKITAIFHHLARSHFIRRHVPQRRVSPIAFFHIYVFMFIFFNSKNVFWAVAVTPGALIARVCTRPQVLIVRVEGGITLCFGRCVERYRGVT